MALLFAQEHPPLHILILTHRSGNEVLYSDEKKPGLAKPSAHVLFWQILVFISPWWTMYREGKLLHLEQGSPPLEQTVVFQ